MEKVEKSFMKSMFFGQIREDLIFPYPLPAKDERESARLILDSVEKFTAQHVDSAKWDAEGKMPKEILSHVAELGLMGLAVPEEYGGLGLSVSGYARVMQEMPVIDASLGLTIGAHQSIGYKALLLFGTPEQKKRFLPRLAQGQLIAAYCLTEPGSGSDAASIKTRAAPSSDGKHYIINGSKLWITNAGIATFLTVFAKTEVIEKGEKKEKVSCFLVELPTPGVSVGPEEHKLGIRASWTNAITFEDVKVPAENLVGGLGHGFKVAMGVLNHGRLGLAAGSVGGAKRCVEHSIRHANERVQFKKKIGDFGMIKEKIGRMMMDTYAAESMVYMTTAFIDREDLDYSIESAIAKVFATEVLWECVDENLQIWGGSGYMKDYPYERWLRDARINRIFEGTNEILRAFIALSGMQGPGQQLAGLAEAIKYPLKGLGPVTDFVGRKIQQRVFGETISKVHPSLKKLSGILETHAVDFSTKIENLLRRHGKEIHLRQLAQKRVADIAIDLYGMACVLSRTTHLIQTKGGPTKAQLEIALAEAYVFRADRRILANFSAIDKNDDDQIKFMAEAGYELGKYPFDILSD